MFDKKICIKSVFVIYTKPIIIMDIVSKKTIQDFWTKNVPGLEVASKNYNLEQKEFYIEADSLRYKYDAYIIPLIDSFSKRGNLILEIGCGLGSDSRYIAQKGVDIVSLDLSPKNVYLTTKGMQLFGLKGVCICADAEKLPFRDNFFDVVYSFGVLHHSPNTQIAINEIRRVLKPKGECIIMLYHKGYAYYALLLRYGWKSFLCRYSKERLMNNYDHTPLSKLYSKKEIFELFCHFTDIEIEITTFGGIQAHPVLRFIYKILHKNKFLMRNFGSYLIIRGRK